MSENPSNNEPDPTNQDDPTSDIDETEQGGSSETPPKPKPKPDDPVTIGEKMKLFFGTHYSGVVCLLTPIIFIFVLAPFPPEKWQWCAYTLFVMAIYWVTECIPLPVTSFLPVVVFPLTGIMDTRTVAACYVNDTIIMFLGSIMLAASVEQSGLHKRLALYAIKIIGYSHKRMLFAVAFVTMFISMWITNTAVATMMVPIVFALLRVYEGQKLLKIYEKDPDTGEERATDLTSCYFCCITFAATIGGIGTLVGTATNLVFKGLFASTYPKGPEYLSFPLYSAFAIPYMIVMNLAMYVCMMAVYMGLFRPNSAAAKSIKLTPQGIDAAKKAVAKDIRELGSMRMHEWMVLILFGGAMILFFSRSPQLFTGWGDKIQDALYLKKKFIRDSAVATMIIFLMTLLPANLNFFKNCTAKFRDELPKGRVPSVLNWDLMNSNLPYSFAFLLGLYYAQAAGGFAMSTAAKKDYTDLNGQISMLLDKLQDVPNVAALLVVIIFTIFITNFASNVAVCNVVTPIAMQLAGKLKINPLWYCLASGVSASYCYMLPVGTPGNLIVQTAAKIPIKQMIIGGFGPTVTTILITWFFLYVYAPIIWPELHELPDWAGGVAKVIAPEPAPAGAPPAGL